MQSRTTSAGFGRRTFVKRTLLASLGVSLASCARSPVYMQGSNGSRQAGALLTIDIPSTELDAETAALIVLKKKVAAIWGDGDDDIEETSD